MVNADPMTERVSFRTGRGKNRVVIADDVDNRTDDLIRPGADRGEHRSGVGGDLVNLQVDISGADQRTERVERALPRQERETPGLDDCDVMVTGGLCSCIGLWRVIIGGMRPTLRRLRSRMQPTSGEAPRAVDQASLAPRPRENLLAGSLPHGARPRRPGLTKVTPRPTSAFELIDVPIRAAVGDLVLAAAITRTA